MICFLHLDNYNTTSATLLSFYYRNHERLLLNSHVPTKHTQFAHFALQFILHSLLLTPHDPPHKYRVPVRIRYCGHSGQHIYAGQLHNPQKKVHLRQHDTRASNSQSAEHYSLGGR